MTSTSNGNVVRTMLEVVIPTRNIAEAQRLVTDDYRDHDPFPGSPTGRSAVAFTVQRLHETHGELSMVVDALLAVGDLVAVRWTVRAIDISGFGRGAPTHRPFIQNGMAWFRLRDGRIAERWACIDRLAALEQIHG